MPGKSVLVVCPHGDLYSVRHDVYTEDGIRQAILELDYFDTEELAIANATEAAGRAHSELGHDAEVRKTVVIYHTKDNKGGE